MLNARQRMKVITESNYRCVCVCVCVCVDVHVCTEKKKSKLVGEISVCVCVCVCHTIDDSISFHTSSSQEHFYTNSLLYVGSSHTVSNNVPTVPSLSC